MKGFKLVFLVFLYVDVIGHISKVSTEFQEGTSGTLSGKLDKMQFSSGIVDLKIKKTVSADLEDERLNSTFFLKGGRLNLDGDGNTINIKAVCSDTCKAYMYLISATSGSLSVKDCVFCVNDHWASVMSLNNTDSIELVSCKLKGTPFQFAMITNTVHLSISKCTFQKLERVSKMVHIFDGFIFRLANCSNMKMENCVFKKVNAGSFKNGAIGWAAPIYMEDCAGITISKCKFQKCTGIMAGAIFSFTTNHGNTLAGVSFKGNKCDTPAGDIMALVSQDPLGVAGLSTVFSEYVSEPATPGKDITRIGSQLIRMTDRTCSNSKKPHYRNGTDETNFKRCLLPAGAVVGIVLGIVAGVIAGTIVFLICWNSKKCLLYRVRHTPFNKQNEMSVFPDVRFDPRDGKEGRVVPVDANKEEEEEGSISIGSIDGGSVDGGSVDRDSLADRK